MPMFDRLIEANARYAEGFTGPLPAQPAGGLAIVTCMDCRIDPAAAFGLELGEAHVIRNAGGLVTDDVLRSLAISQHELGTRDIALVMHTSCGLIGFDDDAFRARLAAESGVEPGWRAGGLTDVPADVRAAVQRVRDCPWLPHRDSVRGFVFDVATARLSEVD